MPSFEFFLKCLGCQLSRGGAVSNQMCYLSLCICQYVLKLAVKFKQIKNEKFSKNLKFELFSRIEEKQIYCAIVQGNLNGLDLFCIFCSYLCKNHLKLQNVYNV